MQAERKEKCNHVIKDLFAAARERNLSVEHIEREAGLGSNVMRCWRTRKEPLLGNVIAALSVMGLDLMVVKRNG